MFFPGWKSGRQPELQEKTQDTAPDKIALLPPEQAQVLASVTAHSSVSVLQEADWQVHRGVLSLAEALQTPAWVGSSLHGWTRVTAWRTDAGRRQAVAAPDPTAINQALWERAR